MMANDNKETVLTKKEYLRKHMNDNVKGAIYGSSLLLIINVIFTLSLVLSIGNVRALIDCFVVMVFAIGILKFLNIVVAVLALIYAVLNTVVMTINTGQFGGWLLILPSVVACIGLFYLNKSYKEYLGVKKQYTQDNE